MTVLVLLVCTSSLDFYQPSNQHESIDTFGTEVYLNLSLYLSNSVLYIIPWHSCVVPKFLKWEASLVRYKSHSSPVSFKRYWLEDKVAWKKF